MPDPASLIHVVPDPGMKQGVEARLAPPNTLTYAQNCRFDKQGRIRKRGGMIQRGTLPSTGAQSGGSWLDEELVCIDNTVLRYQEDSAAWYAIGNDTPFTPLGRYAAQLDETQGVFSACSATIGGVVVVASSAFAPGSSRVRLTGMNIDGKRLWEAAVAGYRPRLLLVGGTLYCIYFPASGSGNIQYSTVTASGTVSAPATLIAGTFAYFDCALLDGTSNWLIGTFETGGNLLKARIMSGTSVSASITVSGTFASTQSLTITGNGTTNDTIWFAWNDGTNVKAVALKWDLSNSWSANITLFGGGSLIPMGQPAIYRVDATHALIACTEYGNIASSPTLVQFGVHSCLFSQAGSISRAGDSWGWALASKFFPGSTTPQLATAARARVWVTSAMLSDFGRRHAILDLSTDGTQGAIDGSIVGLTYEREAADGGIDLPAVNMATFGTDQRSTAFTVLAWNARTGLQAADLVAFTVRDVFFGPRDSARSVQRVGPATYLGGGAALLDIEPPPAGVSFRYHAVNGIPLLPAVSCSTVAGGSLTASQSYTYWPVYEHLDEAGQRVRANGNPFTVATDATNKQVAIHGSVPGGLQRPGMTLHIYRSWLGGAPHRVTPDSGAPLVTDQTGACATSGFVSFTDNMSDATAATKEELETGFPGGALANDPPSGARLVTQGDGRVFVGSWQRNVVWVSKSWVPGEPIQFVDDDTFRIFFPEDLTALAYQDGALIGFSERGIWITSGDGPTDQGLNEYPTPRALPADTGALNWFGVVTAGPGTFYESQSGIMLLPRGFGPPIFIGADVRDTWGNASPLSPNYPGRVLGVAKSRSSTGDEYVHFAIQGGVLVFDMRSNAWSVDVFSSRSTAAAIGPIKNRLGLVWGSTANYAVTWIPEDGVRHADADSSNGNAWCELRLRFGELRPFGICGMGRFLRGRFALNGALDVIQANFVVQTMLDDALDVDDQPEVRTYPLGSGGLQHDGATGMFYIGAELARCPGTALGVELYDSRVPSGAIDVASWDFFGFTLEAQPETGVRELAAEAMQ